LVIVYLVTNFCFTLCFTFIMVNGSGV